MPESTISLSIEGMHCPSCVYVIESELADLNGVLEAKVNLEAQSAVVKFNDSTTGPNEILNLVNELQSKKFTAKLA